MILPALRTKYDAEQVTTSLDSRFQNLGASHELCRSQTSRPPSGASWAVIGAQPSHSVMRVTVTSPRVIDRIESACHQVELVAFGVEEADPPVVVLGQRADLLGAQACQTVGLGEDFGGLEIEMHAVLDRLAFGHLVKHQQGPEPAVGVGGNRREILSGAVGDGAVQGLGPELREFSGVASKLIASTEMLMTSCPDCGG